MNHEIIEEVLSCSTLPSLPAVALKVIELTSDPNVKLPELARVIQNDQALAAKVLRTVNSSFYGLRQKVGTIDKALVMLGLGPVKALALGFSLISTIDSKDDSFDLKGYWRRGLYTAVAARLIAEAARKPFGDEAFLGGLLQDVGMFAMHRALGVRYDAIVTAAGPDHRKLVKAELTALETQHPDIGAMLCQRWKLPDELVLPVKYHERPTAAPKNCGDLVRAVGLGNYAHDAMTDEDPGPALKRLYARADEWFGIKSDEMSSIVRRINESTKEMSRLLQLDTGSGADVEGIIAQADKQLLEVSKQTLAAGEGEKGMSSLLIDAVQTDPLTGVVARAGFDMAMRRGVETAQSDQAPMILVQVMLDGFKPILEKLGREAADEALVGAAALLKKHFEPSGGIVVRLGHEVFAAVIVGADSRGVEGLCAEFLTDLERASSTWPGLSGCAAAGLRAGITASVGASVMPVGVTLSAAQMVTEATRMLQASRTQGGNRVTMPPPAAAAA
ncbi:MAG: GGDEF domain-containing protein [Planctomycetota bacterium]|nr:GGDEF domain-containing protein [Planctomycetota bacterium]